VPCGPGGHSLELAFSYYIEGGQFEIIQMFSCNIEGHPKYKNKLGRDNFDGPSCRTCRKEWLGQQLEAKERERQDLKRKELEDIEEDKEDGWVFVENWRC
jgi:hypothetical protein